MAHGSKKYNKRSRKAGSSKFYHSSKRRKLQLNNKSKRSSSGHRSQEETLPTPPQDSVPIQKSSTSSESDAEEVESVGAYQQLLASVLPDKDAQAPVSDDDSGEDDDSNNEEGSDGDSAGADSSDDDQGDDNGGDRDNDSSNEEGSDGDSGGADSSGDDQGDESGAESVEEEGSNEDTQSEEGEKGEGGEAEEEAVRDDAETADPFLLHFEHDLNERIASSLGEASSWQKIQVQVPVLGKCFCHKPAALPATQHDFKESNLRQLHVKQILSNQVASVNTQYAKVTLKETESLTSFQQKVFSIVNSYQDFYYSDRNGASGEELRLVYCLHALNHVLKTRSRILAHNAKLKNRTNEPNKDYRDQGLTRPKVLMVVPFRDSAHRIVSVMAGLLAANEQSFVSNKNRFVKEYGPGEEADPDDQDPGAKPADFVETFAGNTDDHFRIGVSVAKKSLRLYCEFYRSDIIIASPLGLRTAVGAEGDRFQDFDFLSSIELCILDQADIFHMQNWDHVQHLFEHMHIQPKESHGADFSRIRMWTLNGWSQFYRQSIILSSFPTPALNALFNKHCQNWAGKILVPKSTTGGTIRQIVTQLPQVLHRVDVSSHEQVPQARFDFFVSHILPKLQDSTMKGILLFVPSYLDFVRLRNYFKKESINFVFTNEYTKEKSIVRARSLFFHGRVRILLYTERFHFYRRFRIRGMRHIVFYDLPLYAHFYSEMCNLLRDPKKQAGDDNYTCTVLFTKYDAHKLAAVVGAERAAHMIRDHKSVHMLVTGDD